MSRFPPELLDSSTSTLLRPNIVASNLSDNPNYFAEDPSALQSNARPSQFSIGTGADIYAQHTEALLSTQRELIIVTCFWARSKSLDTLNGILRQLSSRSFTTGPPQKVRVKICFSSSSLIQKIFHTRNPNGKHWPSSTWQSKLGLPSPTALSGLDLEIKSIFFLPFSVMHPKFIIIDRKAVLLPSCNVSWEDWVEGCLKVEGDLVEQFVRFHNAFWGHDDTTENPDVVNSPDPTAADRSALVPSIFLPSPHHIELRFRPLPFISAPRPPPTALNTFLLTAFDCAKHEITITTPNLTCQAVIDGLLHAVEKGVDVTVYTSRRMMLLEQLVTAGTFTEICLWRMKRRYAKLQRKHPTGAGDADSEAQRVGPGTLRVFYFSPSASEGSKSKAVKLHFKSTIVDEEVVVLGSGNMDRASWYTSQELGVAFASRELAQQVKKEFQAFMQSPCGSKYLVQSI